MGPKAIADVSVQWESRPESPYVTRARQIIEASKKSDWRSSQYIDFHRRRYDYLLRLCGQLLAGRREPKVLDIGRSELSRRLGETFGRVDTLGFAVESDHFAHRPTLPFDNRHHVFDLNGAGQIEEWPEIGQFDLIVMAEVIEHVHTAPELVLVMLNSMLAPGGFLVVQTPNAAAVHKRLKLLVGCNPYELIRAYSANPGHFREYTKTELMRVGESAGLKTVRHEFSDYFGCEGTRTKRLLAPVYRCTFSMVPFLRRGQTIVYQSQLSAR